MRKVVIDLDDFDFLETETTIRKGKCLDCGKCCLNPDGSPCEYMYVDSYRDEAKTQPIHSCKLQEKKPVWCVLHPLPDDKLKEGCGFTWENK